MKRPQRVKPELEPLLQFIRIRSEGIDLAYTGNQAASNTQHQQANRNNNGRYNDNSRNNNAWRNDNASRNNNAARSEDASRNNNAPRNANAEQPDSNRANDRRCPDPACVYPRNQHRLYKCFRFTALELEGRKRKATALGVCKRCLRKKCLESKCKSGPCPECGEEHNLWLCSKKNKPPHTQQSNAHASLQNAGAMATVPPPANDSGALLATAIIRIKDANGALIEFRALLDSGSHVSMMTTSAHQRLRLAKPTPALSFNGIGGNKAMSLGTVNVEYHSRFDTDRIFYMTTYVIKKITSKLPPRKFEVDSWTHLDGLRLAYPGYNIPGEIDVLIGAPALSDIVRQGMRRGGKDEPVAQFTKTGWIVFGKTQVTPTRLEAFHTIEELPEIDEEPSLEHMLTRLWEMEKVAERHVCTDEEKICEYHFREHTTQDDDGRYIVKIPIRATNNELGESRSIALRRWLQMEQRFLKNPDLKKSYNDFMEEYLALGHMKACSPLHQGEVGCYIPHHAAGTEKFRVVFDGSCRTANGRSLNDVQLTGEKLQPDLTTTTMRFRTHKFALCADIKKMYRQVLVPDDQMTYQRILWRRDVNHPKCEYNLTTQTYGLRSAPHNCVRALKQCAIDNKKEFSAASVIAERDFYIDDLITGGDSEDEIIEIYKAMTAMLSKGCFELAKWSTNSWNVDGIVNTADVYAAVQLDRVSEIEKSVLGLIWISAGDILRYKIEEPEPDSKLTMRKITSYAAQLYDPNGYLSAVTVVLAKSIIQKMWIAKCTWDGKVPQPIINEWMEFLEELPAISDVGIPRWIGTGKGRAAELHGFCDASKLAYGCAFYVKTTDDEGNIRVSLVAARTRVAPIKRTTIPRMELCGAHLMAKLLKEVRLAHDIEVNNCHLWTDSMIVLHWLENTLANSKVFIANRVSETDELTNGCTWRHVRTDDNPADAASRGIPASKLVGNSLWWHGPEWLKSPSTEWPTTKVVLSDDMKVEMSREFERQSVFVATREEIVFQIDDVDLLHRYSNAHKLFRVTAYVLRFLDIIRNKRGRITHPLTVEEILDAEQFWVKQSQAQYFCAEISAIQEKKKKLPTKSILIGMNPFVHTDGLLRANGRLENALLPFDIVKPILLHPQSRLTKLMIESAHRTMMHAGTQATMQFIRRKYWVPGLRGIVRNIVHRCVKCARFDEKPMTQLMGALPKVRVTPAKAFLKTGVDYCGPFFLKAYPGNCKKVTKAYGAVFVCMVTKAVHIELVSDLTSKSFLAALSRFTSRRWRVQELYSDNGTTFHGADTELTAAIKSWKKLSIEDSFQNLHIKWTFIPPVAPHHGGLWEAAVKSVKNHVKRVIGTQWLTFEEMATVLACVEACLNSRPLSALSDDNRDAVALTPGDLIGTGPPVAPLTRELLTKPTGRLKRWKLLEQMQQQFWSRWQREYLELLLARSKWKTEQTNAAVDDIVLLREDNAPPSQWLMGKIAAVHKGPDGLVRSARVRANGKEYHRPIVKLVPLPTKNEA